MQQKKVTNMHQNSSTMAEAKIKRRRMKIKETVLKQILDTSQQRKKCFP